MSRNKFKYGFLCTSLLALNACSTYETTQQPSYQPYAYDDRPYIEYETASAIPESKTVVVPESYHVGAMHSPVSHSDRDREWVNSQNAGGYTIELADDEKAAQVANTLYQSPKKERMAEVKYQKEGRIYYKGLYGSYPSYEAAQQALSSLPTEIKQRASIKTWGTIQSNVQD